MNLGNRVSQHNFAVIPDANIPRSSFDRSFGRKQTFNADYLVPIFLDEVLPGDTFNLSMTSFARLSTPIVPFMDNLYIDYFFFFVPNRLVWDNWQKFNGEQNNPGDSTDFLIPTSAAGNLDVQNMSLQNYMGLPIGNINQSTCPISALPFRAYNLIWNEWFRDENLQNSAVVDKDNGPDSVADYTLRKRGKRHDYFTSALPWPQKGPSIEIPLGQKAPVYGEEIMNVQYNNAGHVWQGKTPVIPGPSIAVTGTMVGLGPNGFTQLVKPNETSITPRYPIHGISLGTPEQYEGLPLAKPPYADLSEATAATINQLREAFQIQRLYERDARGGTRYIEILRSHFGVISPDARLQRPEFLGGGKARVNINPVAQTSATETQPTPQGNLAAFGTQVGRGIGFQKSFVEHGYIIGLASARADLSYQDGVNRLWSRQGRFDFYWPTLAHLGEQAILNREIFISNDANDIGVFGYQERFAEYRYKPSEILGTFSSRVAQPLDMWHLAQEYTALPFLNANFIASDTPVSRVVAVEDEPQFLMDIWYQLKCARPMPTYSVPGLIDHF